MSHKQLHETLILMTYFVGQPSKGDVPTPKVRAQMRITCQISIGLYYSNIKISILYY